MKNPIYDNESTFLDILADGKHSIALNDQKIELLTRGLTSCKPGDPVLVKLSGAVIDRKSKKGPFFFGLGISEQLSYPIISFSDPSLELNTELNICWYAGYEGCEDLTNRIALILDKIITMTGVRLIVFGGSGGGFASISITSLMKSKVSVLVWNPQTSISKYIEKSVSKYIKFAFPSISDSNLKDNYSKLDKTGVIHEITNKNIPKNVELIYMQNQSDWHYNSHCKPFFSGSKLESYPDIPCFKTSNTLLCIGNWGYGHIAPPKNLLKSFLYELSEGNGISGIIGVIKKDNSNYFARKLKVSLSA